MPYKDKKEQARAQARYRLKLREVVDEARLVGCADCGEKDQIVLQFHHRDPSTKVTNIGQAHGRMAMPKLLEELAKCDVVCANCHLRRHNTVTII